METLEGQRAEAAAALELVADSRAAVAERLTPPWWYYLAAGVLVGGVIASTARQWTCTTVAPACALAGSLLLPRAYRKATGFSFTSVPLGRPLRWLIALVLVMEGLFLAGVALRDVWGWVGPVLAGIVAVPVIIVVGRRYDAAVRAHLRGRDALGVSDCVPAKHLVVLVLVVVGLIFAGQALWDVWGWVGPVLVGLVAVSIGIVVGRRYAPLRAQVRGRG